MRVDGLTDGRKATVLKRCLSSVCKDTYVDDEAVGEEVEVRAPARFWCRSDHNILWLRFIQRILRKGNPFSFFWGAIFFGMFIPERKQGFRRVGNPIPFFGKILWTIMWIKNKTNWLIYIDKIKVNKLIHPPENFFWLFYKGIALSSLKSSFFAIVYPRWLFQYRHRKTDLHVTGKIIVHTIYWVV